MSLAAYSSRLVDKQSVVDTFVGHHVLDRVLDDLRREVHPPVGNHHLIVGRGGSGKTTLLARLGYAVDDDPDLRHAWLPVRFPEDVYGIAGLSDLFVCCLDALAETLQTAGNLDDAAAVEGAARALPDHEPQRRQRAVDHLVAASDRLGRRLLLLVDNVDEVLGRLPEEDEWALRNVLSEEHPLLLVGTSAAALETTYDYHQAFYDFFRIHELTPLGEADAWSLLVRLAQRDGWHGGRSPVDRAPARFRALHALAGGNPRVLVFMHEVLTATPNESAEFQLALLLDRCTPQFKARFDRLSLQSQRVLHALALHWDPAPAAELARVSRLDVNAVSAHLHRLVAGGLAEKVKLHATKRSGFQVADRLFNLWYVMRGSRSLRQRLEWLVRFVELQLDHDAAMRSAGPPTLSVREPEAQESGSCEVRILAAMDLARNDAWPGACHQVSEALADAADPASAYAQLLAFCTLAVRLDHASVAAEALDRGGLRCRFRPLYEAVLAAGDRGPGRLQDLAPEVRMPALRLFDRFRPDWRESQGAARPRRSAKARRKHVRQPGGV